MAQAPATRNHLQAWPTAAAVPARALRIETGTEAVSRPAPDWVGIGWAGLMVVCASAATAAFALAV